MGLVIVNENYMYKYFVGMEIDEEKEKLDISEAYK